MRNLEMTSKGYQEIQPKADEYYPRPRLTCLDCHQKFAIGNGHTMESETPFCYKSTCRTSLTFHVWKLKYRSKG